MRLLIDEKDFRRLSPETRRELLEAFAGKAHAERRAVARTSPSCKWRRPVDLDPELTLKLMHGLAGNHRSRLELFARREGRVTMKQLLAVTRDKDLRVISYFEGAVTRKLRRLLRDPEKKAHLIGWDYDATQWDKDHKTIVNGVLYVTDTTAQSLRSFFARS